MDITNTQLKIVMLPFLAHGHVSPYLELSKKLIDKNFFIYFCSTPIILSSINQKLNEKQSKSIQLVELHLQSSPELPPNRHTTKDLPPQLIPKLVQALSMAAPSFSLILESLKPDLVIYDMFQPWVSSISSSLNIPSVQFFTGGAAAMVSLFHSVIKPSEEDFNIPRLTPRYLHKKPENNFEMKEKHLSALKESLKWSSEIVFINSFEELEGEYFGYFSQIIKKTVVPVGPLIENPMEAEKGDEIIVWLNKKDKGSTVLVSFGSESFLKREEIREVAFGLEISNVNFFWVLRFPMGNDTKLDEVLPEGFIERVGERGMIWQSWAPQTKILAHPCIGGFISHCGWSSIMESVVMGVPIIALPLHVDQPINARLVEQAGFGVEVWRDENNVAMKAEEIAKTIRMVVMEKDGECVREKVKGFTNIMKLKEEETVDVVVKELIKLCQKKNLK